jgi:UDP-N-acetylmuramate--alanine ligase
MFVYDEVKLKKLLNLYFVGIGGIGMSALAQYSLKNGIDACGCDKDLENDTIKIMQQNGILVYDEIYFLESVLNKKIDAFIINNVIKEDHIALKFAKEKNIPIILRSQLLGYFVNSKKLISITGSHGKTSTTALISHIFNYAKKEPTFFVGGIMSQIKNNFIFGKSNLVILESDDAYRSFLTLLPETSIVTNISLEHLETYKDIDDIKSTFLKFINQTRPNGNIIINTDCKNIIDLKDKISRPFLEYGISSIRQNYFAKNIELNGLNAKYDLYINGLFVDSIFIPISGIHGVKNSLASIAASMIYGISIECIKGAFLKYFGVERRMQFVGYFNHKHMVYDDYGHHPVELDSTFSVVSKMENKSVVIFQPHKYSRTKSLWDDFLAVFNKYKNKIEAFYITDVYSAGDDYDEIYNSKNFVKELSKENINAIYVPFDNDFINLKNKINFDFENKEEKLILLCQGAGALNKLAKMLVVSAH